MSITLNGARQMEETSDRDYGMGRDSGTSDSQASDGIFLVVTLNFFVFLFASRKKEKGPASKLPDRDLFLQIGESLTIG